MERRFFVGVLPVRQHLLQVDGADLGNAVFIGQNDVIAAVLIFHFHDSFLYYGVDIHPLL